VCDQWWERSAAVGTLAATPLHQFGQALRPGLGMVQVDERRIAVRYERSDRGIHELARLGASTLNRLSTPT
jgi:hypothetical protein